MKTKQKQIKKTVAARRKTTKPALVRAKIKRSTKKVLVPNKANNYRPHLIRIHGLTAVLVVALLAQVVYGFVTTGHLSVLGRVSHITTAELLSDTNKARQKDGLSGLVINDKLNQAAQLKAHDMFTNNYWAHTSPSGVQPWKWFGDVGYSYSYAGENLAKNYPSADATVEAWMESPTHRANILGEHYTDIGFAVVDGVLQGQNTTLVVALYGAPVAVGAVQSASTKADGFTTSLVNAPTANPLEYFGTAIQSLSPVTLAVLVVMALVAIVGVIAHHYRNNLPKAWKRSWRLHHGMYTFVGMIVLGVLIIVATGGGSI